MLQEGKNIFFDNDDEFYQFCVVPQINIVDGVMTFDLSSAYYNAVNNGCKFIIKDEDSSIFKHQAVSYRTLTQPVKNLVQYFDGITKY